MFGSLSKAKQKLTKKSVEWGKVGPVGTKKLFW